jgi:glutaminyl-peptide cyclotransferase
MQKWIVIILTMCILTACGNNSHSNKKISKQSGEIITQINYKVVKSYPHDMESFTEGFLFHDNKLYESTGSPEEFPYARSIIGIVDLKKGKTDVKIELDKSKYFGEGILFFNDKLYQLTYKNQLGFIYDAKTFKQLGTFSYSNKEGWGMTTDGHSIIMSDGTNSITYWDPVNLKEIKKLNVTYNGSSALYMNELEYINGFIYSNIWTTNNIAKIDPNNGKIIGIINLTPLFLKARKENPTSEATNGIAYDSKKDRIFVTGKFWPYIYQIKFYH